MYPHLAPHPGPARRIGYPPAARGRPADDHPLLKEHPHAARTPVGAPHPRHLVGDAAEGWRRGGQERAEGWQVKTSGQGLSLKEWIRRWVTGFFLVILTLCSAALLGGSNADRPAIERQVDRLAHQPAVRVLLLEHNPFETHPAWIQVRARGLQIQRLAEARALLQTDRPAGLAIMRELYAESTEKDIRKAALAAIVEGARARWPKDYRGRFLAKLLPDVLEAARIHKVPPSVTLAQAILESGWGRSRLARDHHNLFGVKAGRGDPRVRYSSAEHRRGKLRPTRDNFRVFKSQQDAILHHARLLSQDRRYAHARGSWTDWRRFVKRIAPKYASSPRYVSQISSLVERYKLDRWDRMVVEAAERDAERSAPLLIEPRRPAASLDGVAEAEGSLASAEDRPSDI